jgi:MFS family permease
MNSAPGAPAVKAARLGPFLLAPGIAPRHAATLLFASFSTIGLVTFVSFMNPYLFAVLAIPADRQGVLAGTLMSLQEGVQVLIGGLVGAWSDRIGRRPIFIGGLLLMSCGFLVYPLAQSALDLIALRLFYGIGMAAATVMLSTCIAEYIDDRMRGRWMGTVGVCNGLGVVMAAVLLAKTPLAFSRHGLDEAEALRASFWTFASCLALLALLLRWGLRSPIHPTGRRSRLLRRAWRGFAIARHQPRIALAYLTAFASRGDLVIITTFISLWVVQEGMRSGLSVGDATARAGMVFGVAQAVALLWSLVMGLVLDRLPRLVGVCLAFLLAAVGYLMLGLIDDPLGRAMVIAAVVAGIGEASAVVSAGVLIGQEAPATERGVVLGTFGLAGSLGMICLTFIGGEVFDRVGPEAPFLLMAAVNALVALGAFAVHARQR